MERPLEFAEGDGQAAERSNVAVGTQVAAALACAARCPVTCGSSSGLSKLKLALNSELKGWARRLMRPAMQVQRRG